MAGKTMLIWRTYVRLAYVIWGTRSPLHFINLFKRIDSPSQSDFSQFAIIARMQVPPRVMGRFVAEWKMSGLLRFTALSGVSNLTGALGRSPAMRFIRDRKALLVLFARDTSGSYLIIGALMMPVLVGSVGLGTDYGLWVYTHQAAQSAADSAAVSAATDGRAVNMAIQANAVTALYGFVDGLNGTRVTVNQPPKSGTHTTVANAIEVIVTQQKAPLFSAAFISQPLTITARSVAVPNVGTGCVIALDPTASGAITVQGSSQINLQNCNLYDNSNDPSALTIGGAGTVAALSVGVVGGISGQSSITASSGIKAGLSPIPDPYAAASFPPFYGCDQNNRQINTSVTLSPGVFCGGLSVTAGAVVTLNPGIYYMDQGSLSVSGNATINGAGVTIVFTSGNNSNFATASIGSNSNVNLTAPTTGPTAGIVIFGDRRMPVGTPFKMTGGTTQSLGGAIYLPKAALIYAGGSSAADGCTQIVADTLSWSGTSSLSLNCNGYATKPIGSNTASLME
jgi:Flp pilus assembly protein TadG